MVMSTEFRLGSTGQGLANGFRADGWAVHEIDSRLLLPSIGTIPGRLASRLLQPWMVKAYNDAILTAVERLRPQAFVTVKGLYINSATLNELARMGIPAVNYYPDNHFDYPGFELATLSSYAVIATTKSFQVQFLQQLVGTRRVVFVHHGYCDLVQRPYLLQVKEDDHLADVTYVGNYTANKERWLRLIARRLPNIRLRIVGYAWERARDDVLRRCAMRHGLEGDFYARALQHSRVNVAVHGERNGREGWQDLVSTRTFEIPACKGFMLHVDNAEIRELFEPEHEIDVFASEDELIEKIVYYLARPDLRRQMIERAYARCVPAYGYNARAAVISRRIDALLGARTESIANASAPWATCLPGRPRELPG
jgi:spore maturation protein CgeB